MTRRLRLYAVIFSSLVCVSSTSAANKRQKRQTFNFPTNVDNVNWGDDFATVPTLNGPLPDLSSSNDSSNFHTNSFADFATVPTWNGPPPDSFVLNDPIDDPGIQHFDDHLETPDISSKAMTNPSTKNLTPIRNYRYDCRPSKNVCIYWNRCDKEFERCAMNLQCTNSVCVDRKKPTTEPSVVNDKEETGAIGRVQQQQQRITNSTMELNASTTERNRQCSSSGFLTCVHGYCVEKKMDDGGQKMWCVCDKGWSEFKCDTRCTLDCVHGTCHANVPDGTHPENVPVDHMECNCKSGWEGNLCQEEIPDLVDEANRKTLTIGLSLGSVLVVVMCLSSLVLVVLWRKRVIVVMKLVYFFKLEEAGDGRYYDAYISMGTSSKGMDFVKDKLCPILQDFGFRFYVQARDQLAGEMIVESIHQAMEQSRRTILIITPDYLRNEWSTFECIIAQIETLKLHQRIIPIVLEDISAEKQNMNKTLKHILESVKCLKFPTVKSNEKVSLKEKKRKEDKFWERLKLTMPKKKKCKEEKEADTEISELEEVVVRDQRPIDISSIGVMYKAV